MQTKEIQAAKNIFHIPGRIARTRPAALASYRRDRGRRSGRSFSGRPGHSDTGNAGGRIVRGYDRGLDSGRSPDATGRIPGGSDQHGRSVFLVSRIHARIPRFQSDSFLYYGDCNWIPRAGGILPGFLLVRAPRDHYSFRSAFDEILTSWMARSLEPAIPMGPSEKTDWCARFRYEQAQESSTFCRRNTHR